jgi:type VI protein secretion system component Hcp
MLQQGADGSTTAALIYTMNNVVISSARTGGNSQSETLGLNFDSVTYSTP